MRTAELIDQLATSVRPISGGAADKRLCAGLAAGGLVAMAALAAWLGMRPDLASAMMVPAFWMKWAFTLSLAVSGFVLVRRLGQPGRGVGRAWWGLAAPVALVGMMAVAEVLGAAPQARLGLVLGHTAAQCTVAILGLAVPVFAGLVWAFRRLAPTRLRLAGFAAGLLAGAVGASVYVLTCPEQTPAFMAIWYDAGILLASAAGAAVGPRLLRW